MTMPAIVKPRNTSSETSLVDEAGGAAVVTGAIGLQPEHNPCVLQPFDAVLLVAFGGPQGRDDVRPFLANVLKGRRVSPERVEEVAHHYEMFGGVSPITAITRQQAEGLRVRLESAGQPLPVYVGMRNW